MSLKWVDDPVLESHLVSYGVKWTRKDIKLEQMDRDKSLKNMGRVGDPIKEEIVAEYGCAMIDGASFPAIAVYFDSKTKKYVVVSGNHRTEAAKECGEKIMGQCYVLESDDQTIEVIARSANGWVGLRENREARVQQALQMIEKFNMSVQEAAKINGLKASGLSDARKGEEIRNKLLSLGVEKAERLSRSLLGKLSAISSNDNVLYQAGQFIANTKINYEEVPKFVTEVRSGKTEAQQIGVISQWEEDKKNERILKSAGVPLRVRTKFWRQFNMFAAILQKNPSRSKLQLREDELASIASTWKQMDGYMKKVLGDTYESDTEDRKLRTRKS